MHRRSNTTLTSYQLFSDLCVLFIHLFVNVSRSRIHTRTVWVARKFFLETLRILSLSYFISFHFIAGWIAISVKLHGTFWLLPWHTLCTVAGYLSVAAVVVVVVFVLNNIYIAESPLNAHDAWISCINFKSSRFFRLLLTDKQKKTPTKKNEKQKNVCMLQWNRWKSAYSQNTLAINLPDNAQ